jgi:hypothetical protein
VVNKVRIVGPAAVAVLLVLLLSGCGGAGAGGNGIEEDVVLAVDQNNWPNRTGGLSPPVVQSFVPREPTLAGVDIFVGGTGSLTADVVVGVYSNWDTVNGVSGLLASGEVTDVDRGTTAELRWSPVPITPGTTYYIHVIYPSGSLAVGTNSGNPYADGEVLVGGGNISGRDILFRTYYAVP